MSFPGTLKEKGVYEITFPKLLGRITEGKYEAEVEVIVDGKHFTPLTETVEFTKEVKPTVSLKETMRQIESTVKITRPVVTKIVEAKRVDDVRGLLVALREGGEIDTSFAIRCVEGLASGQGFTDQGLRIAPSRTLSEAEAVVALRLIREHGSDIEGAFECATLRDLSTAVRAELRETLVDKGASKKVLLHHGL
ncbi:MAG: hypothetical protein EOO77_44940 [Oxalobacteraceae bacterium]|nr:MAG: hypothetical protein EOO77_44940 [Oxalobacteraceae bacterium]